MALLFPQERIASPAEAKSIQAQLSLPGMPAMERTYCTMGLALSGGDTARARTTALPHITALPGQRKTISARSSPSSASSTRQRTSSSAPMISRCISSMSIAMWRLPGRCSNPRDGAHLRHVRLSEGGAKHLLKREKRSLFEKIYAQREGARPPGRKFPNFARRPIGETSRFAGT
jgi:hypothetical protein